MTMTRFMMYLVLVVAACQCARTHHLRHHGIATATAGEPEVVAGGKSDADGIIASPKNRRSLQPGFYSRNGSEPGKDMIPYSYKKLDKMMKKAILQIILGELRPADMLLLKALNYTLEEVMAIREHELSRIKKEKEFEARMKKVWEEEMLNVKYQHRKMNRESNIEAYNRQAVYDYENEPTAPAAGLSSVNADYDDSATAGEKDTAVTEESFRQGFDKVMEPHVVFKIRYDDSEFDSSSDEKARTIARNHHTKTLLRTEKVKSSSVAGESFQAPNADRDRVAPALSALDLEDFNRQAILDYENLVPGAGRVSVESYEASSTSTTTTTTTTEKPVDEPKKKVEYEGLEWVGGDVYRVIPEAMEALLNEEATEELEDSAAAVAAADSLLDDYEAVAESLRMAGELDNDTMDCQMDEALADALPATDGANADNQNLTAHQRYLQAQRKDQGQKAIEDIKLKILTMTGRFNSTSSNNQVQRERLTMFSPTCQMPHNTDAEAWNDPFSMNMHFQLNLTSGEHLVAAKLRLFKLPQDIVTSPSHGSYEEEEEDEKKIRVSVYFYTKSLKKHRAKKRLMDSIVTPLSSQGSHLVLDVRQGLRFWRPNASTSSNGNGNNNGSQQQQQPQQQSQHNSNHGLIVQVEDQDGRPLKPALYLQKPSCGESDADEKAYKYGPALFVGACTRYVRLVNGRVEMCDQCRPPSLRH